MLAEKYLFYYEVIIVNGGKERWIIYPNIGFIN